MKFQKPYLTVVTDGWMRPKQYAPSTFSKLIPLQVCINNFHEKVSHLAFTDFQINISNYLNMLKLELLSFFLSVFLFSYHLPFHSVFTVCPLWSLTIGL